MNISNFHFIVVVIEVSGWNQWDWSKIPFYFTYRLSKVQGQTWVQMFCPTKTAFEIHSSLLLLWIKSIFLFGWIWTWIRRRIWFLILFITVYFNFFGILNKAIVDWEFRRLEFFKFSLVVKTVWLEKFFDLLFELKFVCKGKNILPWIITTTFRGNRHRLIPFFLFLFFMMSFFPIKIF